MAETDDYKRALDSVARFLALRDHSVHELKTKLSRRYEEAIVEAALAEAGERNWLQDESTIAQRLAEQLSRRGKSRGYISAQLKKRRLPPVEFDADAEYEKARELVVRKFGSEKLSYEDKGKAFRFLKYRGFDDRCIRKALEHEQP